MLRCLAIAVLCLCPAAVLAQNPNPETATEHVTVTGSKAPLDHVLHDFVASYTAPSPASNKVARWHDGICPGVVGLPQSWDASVVARVRAVAAQAGAPVRPDTCHPNIDIVFSRDPQALLDDVLAKKPFYLGYHDISQGKTLSTVRHAIQSWYMTQTVDAQGVANIDDKQPRSSGVSFTVGMNNTITLADTHVEYWSGNRLSDERRSELIHALIVVDINKAKGVRLNAIADAVAMLALAQTTAFDACQPVPSISNLMTPDCDTALKPDGLSGTDLAYLHALYHVDPDDSLVQQKSEIAFEMKKSLSGP